MVTKDLQDGFGEAMDLLREAERKDSQKAHDLRAARLQVQEAKIGLAAELICTYERLERFGGLRAAKLVRMDAGGNSRVALPHLFILVVEIPVGPDTDGFAALSAT